jgi:8-oxo-dGTP diphosphatase
MNIEIFVHALIIRNGDLLVNVNPEGDGEWLDLPGGQQVFGETLKETLQREFVERTAVTLEVTELISVREYIGVRHEYADQDAHFHIVGHIFAAVVPDGYKPEPGHKHGVTQTWVRWQPLATLESAPFYPKVLAHAEPIPAYLGDIN